MALLSLIFNRLHVTIVPHKTVGYTVQLQYLGIILDTDKMESINGQIYKEARLPDDKLSKIITILDIFKNKHSISKRELLSPKFCFQGNSTGLKLCSLSVISGSLCETITSLCETQQRMSTTYSYVA